MIVTCQSEELFLQLEKDQERKRQKIKNKFKSSIEGEILL